MVTNGKRNSRLNPGGDRQLTSDTCGRNAILHYPARPALITRTKFAILLYALRCFDIDNWLLSGWSEISRARDEISGHSIDPLE